MGYVCFQGGTELQARILCRHGFSFTLAFLPKRFSRGFSLQRLLNFDVGVPNGAGVETAHVNDSRVRVSSCLPTKETARPTL